MCIKPTPIYIPQSNVGLKFVGSKSDGTTMNISWNKAYPIPENYLLGYNIYFSTNKNDIFNEGPKYLSITSVTSLDISEFTPGDIFYFAVRATEFDPTWMDLNTFPNSGDSKVYPEGVLLQAMTETSNYIMVSDINTFPNYGVVQVGDELIKYLNKDNTSNKLLNITRGFLDSNIRIHNIDGYDGYYYENPLVKIFKGYEDKNETILSEVSDYAYPNFAVNSDGYYSSNNENLIYTDLSASDSDLINVPKYDYKGWRRINPKDVLLGKCVGSYFGGEHYCADGYDGVGRLLRGGSVTDENLKRQEILLDIDGNPCVLVRKVQSGIRCSCYTSTKEYPDDRCPNCLGTGFIIGWEQIFNARRSDGRILVRFDATVDDIPYQDAGLESTFSPNCWTLPVPTIRDRDMIIRYNKYTGQEEFRYEILNVTRNVLIDQVQGAQKFTVVRVRKTDPFYKFNVFADSSTMPQIITTSIGYTTGLILPHTHTFEISENILNISQINQVTSQGGANVSQNHSHKIINGVIQPTLGHTHTFVL